MNGATCQGSQRNTNGSSLLLEWVSCPATARILAAAPLSTDGRLQMWVATADGRLFNTWKTGPAQKVPKVLESERQRRPRGVRSDPEIESWIGPSKPKLWHITRQINRLRPQRSANITREVRQWETSNG